ncbi:Methyl methanesulfonate-sensitivity protein 22 [Wickerhamomyces ciferrii]|uniref:Methyl methanesulfonate-sensitivity protein 22 n=1 Tax=Wickerhamomyces ciferrii (strain ATCC 14091 / BCRC 22168 / CBS 111 / JCM 3599 / NBRC 0793 / NRRL Y-1031 F-60-10) TaxID=1206466 RepID=K0K7J5_WICCF|nr:Methyl methanesulfonate-sensitivity protein 22 [Wickerhamomyces ciferrii]CCH40765.1 Methyl methanesulfonate-sensitivity protein 22 [Wickerhamomyces ciferrii]
MKLSSQENNSHPDDIEIPMTSPNVSDSEEELETLTLSNTKLDLILNSKLQKHHTFIPRRTGALSSHLSRSINNAFLKAVSIPKTIEGSASASLNSHNPLLNTDTTSIYSLDAIQDYRRSNRRRNISFYQQHIYTIDSVSYTLRISLEDATELVKQRPEIIEMYHIGKLEKYLRNGFKLDEPKEPKIPEGAKKSVSQIPIETSEESDVVLSQNDLEKDPLSSDSDSSFDSDSEDVNEQNTKETTFVFRGRQYKDLDAVSRASGLPKSFFSMKSSTHVQPVKRGKNNQVTQRAGVAKKKRSIAPSTGSLDNGNMFTTDNNLKETTPLDSSNFTAHQEEFEVSSNDEDVDVLEYSKYDREHPNSGTTKLDDVDEVAARYDGRYLDDYDQTDEDFDEAEQFQVEDDVMFVGQREVQGFPRKDNYDFSNADFSSESDFFMEGKSHNNKNTKQTQGEPGLIDVMLSKSANSKKTIRSINSQHKSSRNLQGRQHVTSRYSNIGKRQKPKDKTRKLKRVSRIQLLSKNIDRNSVARSEAAQTLESDKPPKKQRKTNLWVNPVLSNYQNTGSTIVYEGIGAPTDNSTRYVFQPQPGNQEIMKTASETVDHLFCGFEWVFKRSSCYKILFDGAGGKLDSTFSITLSGNTITFSNYRTDQIEQLQFFFKILSSLQSIKLSTNLFEKIDAVVCFCSTLSVNDIRSLVVILDDFVLRIESSIRKKGQVKDSELFLLSSSLLFYHLVAYVYKKNHIQGYDLNSKLLFVMNIYIEVLCYISGSIVSQKIKENGHFSQALIIAIHSSSKNFTSVLENSNLPDLQFLSVICQLYKPSVPLWSPVTKLLKEKLSNSSGGLRNDIKVIYFIKLRYGWELNEDLLVIIYEILKANKFGNFNDENSYPVIFSEFGINKDTALNIYLNMLIEFSKESSSLSGRFLEKIIPVSKITQMELPTFCNRVNILLCLALIFKKNFESRVDQILLNIEVKDKIILQKMIRALEQMIKINDRNGFPSKLKPLVNIIEKCVNFNEIDQIKQVLLSLDDENLHAKTKQSIIEAISYFSREDKVITAFSQFIRNYVNHVNDRKDFEFLKSNFSDLNPSKHANLWCLINGKLISNDLENWSRLINFNDFQDEPFIYSYILRHSGLQIYQLEKEKFIIVLAKALTSFKISGSLNSYIRELEKLDPGLVSSKGVLVQSHKLQFAIDLISKIMINETNYLKSRVFSFLLIHLKKEYEISKGSIHYKNFLHNIVQHIDKFTDDFPASLIDFWRLKSLLGIKSSPLEIDAEKQQQRQIDKRPKISISQKLINLEKFVLTSYLDQKPLDPKQFFIEKPAQQLLNSNEISSSSFYEICCLISIHGELIQKIPSCWVLLSKLTNLLNDSIKTLKNLSQIDLFCILKTLKIFRFILKFKHSNYIKYRCIMGANIYKILNLILNSLEGTNDMNILYENFFIFLSKDLIYNENRLDNEAGFLIQSPIEISEMILKSKIIQNEMDLNFETEQGEFIKEFEKFCGKMNFNPESGDLLNESNELELDYSVVEDIFI